MESQMIGYEVRAPADQEVLGAAIDIYCWRMEALLRAGYTQLCADVLAQDRQVDLHLACDLRARGCAEHTAYLILS